MKFTSVLIKTIIFLAILSTGYYFFARAEIQKEKNISSHWANLVKNKLSYVGLAKLDSKDPGFDIEKSNLIGIIKETNKIGLEKPLNNKEKDIFIRQNAILDKVFATKSYEEGVSILKSKESVNLLSDQTNLIQELETQIVRLKALRELHLP